MPVEPRHDGQAALIAALAADAAALDALLGFPSSAFKALAVLGLVGAPPLEDGAIGTLLQLLATVGRGDLGVGQFYPSDWLGNTKLRRCSHSEKGICIDTMCLMHDSKEFGVLRWPLEEIAQAVGCKLGELCGLRDKDVLKGADMGVSHAGFSYTPRHGG